MISWASKDASETVNRSYSWLGRLNGVEIASAALTVQCGTVTLTNTANTVNSISTTISGGAECEDVVLISTIVTNETIPQTLEETITLAVRPSIFLNLGPSTSTKRDLVSMAYEQCSLSGYEFDVTPEEMFSGLRALDANMAEDQANSIRLNYNFPALFGQGDLEDYSGIPDAAINYAALSLADYICSNMGKTLSQRALARLTRSRDSARALTACIPTMPYRYGTPRGAGNRTWWGRSPFLPNPVTGG